jgi:hypothetical protein
VSNRLGLRTKFEVATPGLVERFQIRVFYRTALCGQPTSAPRLRRMGTEFVAGN